MEETELREMIAEIVRLKQENKHLRQNPDLVLKKLFGQCSPGSQAVDRSVSNNRRAGRTAS